MTGRTFREGFDWLPIGMTNASAVNTLLQQRWTTAFQASGSTGITVVAGLSSANSNSAAINIDGGTAAGSTLTTLIGATLTGFALGFRLKSSLRGHGVQLQSGGAAQVSYVINSTGNMEVRRGAVNGTLLATTVESVTNGSTHYWEIKGTVNTTTGSATIYLDGVATSVALTGANTANTGTNSFTGLSLQSVSGSGFAFVIDDIYINNTTASAPNNDVLLTNPLIETVYGTSDAQTQWTLGAAVFGQGAAYQGITATNAPGANQIALRKFTAAVAGNVTQINLLPGATSTTAKFKPCIYADSGGAPNGAPLQTGSEVIGCTSGTVLALPLTASQAIVAGTTYWIGYITDTSVALSESDSSLLGYRAANTYASGFPTTPVMTSGQASWMIWAVETGVTTNWNQVGVIPALGTRSYIYSATVNNEDLYNFPALSSNPSTIHDVSQFAIAARTDSGTRTYDIRINSGGSDSGGDVTGINPGTSFVFGITGWDTDPNTGVAWTSSGVNNATGGPKIAS